VVLVAIIRGAVVVVGIIQEGLLLVVVAVAIALVVGSEEDAGVSWDFTF
jgi:hypothetical protein